MSSSAQSITLSDEAIARAEERNMVIERQAGGISFSAYTEDPTLKRQLFWLSYTASALKTHGNGRLKILDIGSNIYWLIGVASGYDVKMVDVRPHPLSHIFPFPLITADATNTTLPDGEFDVVTFPQLLHWVGTTTYGDKLNVDGDRETLLEVSRVLKKDGIGIFTTIVVPTKTTLKIGGRRLFLLDDLEKMISGAGLAIVDLSLRDTNCEAIRRSDIPPISNVMVTEGNPDEDLAWAVVTVKKI